MSFKQITVDGTEYKITHLNASAAIKLFTRITKIAGGPIAAFTKMQGGVDISEVLPSVMEELAKHMHEDEVLSIVQELLRSVTKNNGSVTLDADFSGKLPALFDLLNESLEVNYGDFLQKLMSLAK